MPRVKVEHSLDPNGNEVVVYNIDAERVPPDKLVDMMIDWVTKLKAMEGRRRVEVHIDTAAEPRVYDLQ